MTLRVAFASWSQNFRNNERASIPPPSEARNDIIRRVMKQGLALIVTVAMAACGRQEPPAATTAAPPSPPPPTAALGNVASLLYVTNEVGGTLTIIDAGTQTALATQPLGKRPRGITLSPDRSQLYVALSGSPIGGPGVDEKSLPPADKAADGIGVVDVQSNKLLKILKSGSDPETIAVSPDGKLLFVANEDTGQASV